MSALLFDVYQSPVFVDDRLEYDGTFKSERKGLPGINRSHLMFENSFAYALGYWRCKLWQCNRNREQRSYLLTIQFGGRELRRLGWVTVWIRHFRSLDGICSRQIFGFPERRCVRLHASSRSRRYTLCGL